MDRPLKVLLVEDHAVLGDMMVQMLQMLGCEAVRAGTAGDAAQQADGAWDLVLCDLNLPDGSARDVRQAFPEDSSAKFYILSAFDEQTLRTETRSAAYDGYLAKPVEIEQLQSLLNGLER
jgi:DNA-binding response OmpR family regulator